MLTSSNSVGYYYYMCIWKEIVNKNIDNPQIIVGFADFHDQQHSINRQQQVDFDQILLKKLATYNGKLIVEDLCSVNNDGRMNCCNFGIHSEQGVLGRLADKAREAGVGVDNVEYRYCRVAGISPLLNKLNQNPSSFKSAVAIDTLSLHKEVIDEINTIKNYNDGKILNAVYKNAIASVNKELLRINFGNSSRQKKITIADYCSKFSHNQYRQELEKLCIFDSSLIDMKIIHSIVTSPQTRYIVIAAGGAHIEQMNTMLKKIGYALVFATPQPLCLTLKKLVNINNNTQPEDIPQPIDIAAVSKFIN